jgi:hypothetical protein
MRWLLAASLWLCGCGDLLNASDYGILEPEANPCGPLEVPTDDGCVLAGVSECGPSFVADDDGGCEPLLPAEDCSLSDDGRRHFAHPGNSKCRVAGLALTCPNDPDPTTYPRNFLGGTRYVWADAPNPGDGTAASPHATLSEAVAAAAAGEVILIANGVYEENVVIDKPLRVQGVCGPQVEITGVEPDGPAITVATEGGAPVEIAALGLSGAGPGLLARDSRVVLEHVWIDGTADVGIELFGGQASLSRLLLQNIRGAGIVAWGSRVTLTESHIRDIQTDLAQLGLGDGIVTHPGRHEPNPEVGDLTLDRVLIERARHAAVRIEGSEAVVRDSVVRAMESSDGSEAIGLPPAGFGISVAFDPGRKIPGYARVEQSLVEGAWGAGLRAFGARLEVSQTTVRDTRALAPPCRAHALRVIGARATEADVSVYRSLFEGSRGTGVHVFGGDVLLGRTIIRNTEFEPCGGALGDGVGVYEQPGLASRTTAGARLSLQHSLLEGHQRAAALTAGGTLVFDRSLLRDSPHDIWSTDYPSTDTLEPVAGQIHRQGVTHCEDEDGFLHDCALTERLAEPDLFTRDAQGERQPLIGVGSNVVIPVGDEALAEAIVWILDRDELPVAISDADGQWELRAVPAHSQVILVHAAEDHIGSSFAVQTRGVGVNPGQEFLFSLALMVEFEKVFGSPVDYSQGLAHISDLRGLVVSTDPAGNIDPIYVVDDFPQFVPSPEASDAFLIGLPSTSVALSFESQEGKPASCDLELPSIRFGLETVDDDPVIPVFPGMTNRLVLPLPCTFE